MLLAQKILEFVRREGNGFSCGLLDFSQDGGFETGKTKIKAAVFGFAAVWRGELGVRETVLFGVAIFGSLGDRGATRVGETENFRDLIKTFADGIVSGGADDFELVVSEHTDNLGMPT